MHGASNQTLYVKISSHVQKNIVFTFIAILIFKFAVRATCVFSQELYSNSLRTFYVDIKHSCALHL